MLKYFWAVTRNSVFLAFYNKTEEADYVSHFTEIRSRKKNLKAERSEGGQAPMLSVGGWLQLYSPRNIKEKSLADSLQVDWRNGTDDVVALFLTEEEAVACWHENDPLQMKPCDPRWHRQTKEVLARISNDHPCFHITTWSFAALFPKAELQILLA